MGQCVYVAENLGPHTGGPVVREMPSEVWMNPAEAGRVLAKDHLLNTTAGVWFYESDLWDKRALRRRLTALARHVTSPSFLREYEAWGRKQLEAQRQAARRDDPSAIVDLFALSNLLPETTGVRGAVLWVSAGEFGKRNSKHGPRLLVVPGNTVKAERLKDAVAVPLTSPPEIVGTLPPKLRRQVARFIDANREVLLQHWNGQLDSKQVMGMLKRA